MNRRGRRRPHQVHEAKQLELTLGGPAAGGTCVAHSDQSEDTTTYFVRGGLPGERVRAQTTGSSRGGKVRFATVVEVLTASADRVSPPCPMAATCGGCDFQHVALPAQRTWKAQVLVDQLRRLGGIAEIGGEPLSASLQVAPVPLHPPSGETPSDDGWRGWRTRVAVDTDVRGHAGFHAYRSSTVVAVGSCPVVVPELQPIFAQQGMPGARVYATAADIPTLWPGSGATGSSDVALPSGWRQRAWVTREALGRSFRVATGGFWQAHIKAPDLLAAEVRDRAALVAGERALDLYAGVGLFATALTMSTNPAAQVVAVEGDAYAARLARRNLHDLPAVTVVECDVRDYAFGSQVAVTVLDPPRSGAGAAVIDAVSAVTMRAIVHVGCDGASTARDLGRLVAGGWHVQSLRAYDLFPMTQHVETVALLERTHG